jgi:hypothetical protein
MHYSHFKTQSLQHLKAKNRSPTDKNTKHTQMTYTCGHILCNNTNSTNANQERIVTAQSTAEDPLKMVLKKDRNM